MADARGLIYSDSTTRFNPEQMKSKMSRKHLKELFYLGPASKRVCFKPAIAGLLAGIAASAAYAQTPADSRIQNLEQENAALKKRLDALEAVVQKEGIGAEPAPSYVKALSKTTISGFVTASYFY